MPESCWARRALVTGGGTIGCLTGHRGAARRRRLGHGLGRCSTGRSTRRARWVRRGRSEAISKREALAAPQFDVAFEASGSFAALKACVAAVKRGGTIVQVGTLPHEPLPFVVNEIMVKELDLKGAFRWGIEFDWAVEYIASRRVDVKSAAVGAVSAAGCGPGFRAGKGQDEKHQGTADRCLKPKTRSFASSHTRRNIIMLRFARLALVAAALAVASGVAVAQPVKLKWAHVYETSGAVSHMVGVGCRGDREAHQRQLPHRRVPGVERSARSPTSTRG